MKYTEPTEVNYDSYFAPDNQAIHGYVTKALPKGHLFGDAVHRLVLYETGRGEYVRVPGLLMTTRFHWSGYSEYTITNEWSEIILTVPVWNWEREWPSLGEFLRTLADANPEANR